jgi:NADH-quinone oxidoreductase subunit D
METVTGNRNHYAMMKVGGVRRDILPEHVDYILERIPELVKFTDLIKGAVLDDPVLHARLKGVGVMTAEDMHDYGGVGPTSRASACRATSDGTTPTRPMGWWTGM